MTELGRGSLAVVIIGRNEGERLERCIESVRAMEAWPGLVEIVYVDSGSEDGSPEAAEKNGVRVLRIASDHPTAALGRNAGWRAAEGAEYILFLDGDTVLAPRFVRVALETMEANPDAAGVWGHRRELRPEQSIYTRVLDLDWIYPLGEFPFCGGDVLMRRAALEGYGHCVGLAFQVVGDVRDSEADTAALGKTAGKDAENDKPTCVTLLGAREARQMGADLHREAL